MTKKTKQVSISVDKGVWDDFVKKVESVEGKTYGKIGPTLTNLIREYYLSAADDGDDDKIRKLEKELSDNYDRIDNLLMENKELDEENSGYSKKIQQQDKKIGKLNDQINKLTDAYETTICDNEKYDELLNELEDKVLKLSEENQKLIETLNIKSEENEEIYITAIKNEEKYKNTISKYKNQIKKLKNNNKILLKRFRHDKKAGKKDEIKYKNSEDNKKSDNPAMMETQQLQKQYNEYMKQFENIKRKRS